MDRRAFNIPIAENVNKISFHFFKRAKELNARSLGMWVTGKCDKDINQCRKDALQLSLKAEKYRILTAPAAFERNGG